uniref:Uncharacterized protein MANES_11G071500 n=1 Tax=Rhizophora mucronata TaxID=61149 RepID=A0A2P2KW56_RHIMU
MNSSVRLVSKLIHCNAIFNFSPQCSSYILLTA